MYFLVLFCWKKTSIYFRVTIIFQVVLPAMPLKYSYCARLVEKKKKNKNLISLYSQFKYIAQISRDILCRNFIAKLFLVRLNRKLY